MDNSVNYKCSHLHKDPVIKIIEKNERGGLITICFAFPFPLTWHGDNYTYDPDHTVEEVFMGEDESELMDRIRSHVRTILVWEHRKAHENIGNLVNIESMKTSISQSVAVT
ncbi:hypothetical protein [Bacterioplanoides sp.]|uniref:hypothetical protein n=1 Tax=Bacterioplanoides sp. TaxID=2066072 RepID=UPI003B5C6CF0